MENENKTQFTVKIEEMSSNYAATPVCIKIFNKGSFDTKKEANKFKRSMIKEHDLINHAGHIVNYSKRKELFTNY